METRKEGYRRTVTGPNPEILKVLKSIYKANTVVFAEKVDGVAKGTKGIVKHFQKNGDILVVWESGYTSPVEYGRESVRLETKSFCMLEDTDVFGGCDRKNCGACGWCQKEFGRRINRINNGDFKFSDDGTKYLSINVR